MGRIKILHIITGGLRREGIASAQLEFFKHIDRNRFQIDIAAVHGDTEDMIEEYERIGCKVTRFPDRMRYIVSYFFSLSKELKKNHYDIVHIHGSSALMSIELLAAKLTGIPVRIVHSRNTKCNNEKSDKVLRPLFNKLYTDGVACGVDAGRWLFGEKKFTVIHNGKDFSRFRFDSETRQREREKHGLQNKTVIGHVGGFNYQKNQEFLIDIFAEYLRRNPNSVLYMIGDGGMRISVAKRAEELGILDKVIFAGNVCDVPERLQSMDIMVFPSRFEGLPNVVLEWQAEGLPCLISDKITKECAPSDFVEFASIEEEPQIWADKIEQMIAKYKDRKSQAKRGTQALKENGFDIKDATKQLEYMYMKLVKH